MGYRFTTRGGFPPVEMPIYQAALAEVVRHLAATEVAGPDPRTDMYSASAQADDVVRRLRLALEHGVDRVFWAAPLENLDLEPAFRHEGLIERDSWRRKPAFDALRALIAGDPR